MINNKRFLVRLTIGIVFVISALTKLATIGSFELFIFSFGILTLNMSFLLARLIIFSEFVLGFFIIMGWKPKSTLIVSFSILILFSGFIIFMWTSGNNDHCHCFGDIIGMSHPASLIKNSLFLVALIFSYPSPSLNIKYPKIILTAILSCSLILPFTVTPPSFLMHGWYARRISYDDMMLNQFLAENPYLASGKKVVSFYGIGCKYCEMAAKKLTVIAKKSGKEDHFANVFWGTEQGINNFYNETETLSFKYTIIPSDRFLRITNGKMPLIFLLDNGEIFSKYSYAIIDDQAIGEFLR